MIVYTHMIMTVTGVSLPKRFLVQNTKKYT